MKKIIIFGIVSCLFLALTIVVSADETWHSEDFGGKLTVEEIHTPILSNPNPGNKSINVPIATSSWNITINEPDGDIFDWTIDTSPDIGNSYHNSETNGSKSCTISGLDYSTNYTVFVNATDDGSGDWTNETFWFVTESEVWSNTCPSCGLPSPSNHSIDVSVDTDFSVVVADPDGNNTWGNITCSNDDTVEWSDQANGTRTLTITSLDYSTNYTIWVNYTDVLHICDVHDYFWFITEDAPSENVTWHSETFGGKLTVTDPDANNPPSLSNENPTNGSTGSSLNPELYVDCSNDDGSNFDLYIKSNASGSWSTLESFVNVGNNTGTYFDVNPTNMDSYDTTYYWSVNVTDNHGGSGNWTNETYHFTTEESPIPTITWHSEDFGGKLTVNEEIADPNWSNWSGYWKVGHTSYSDTNMDLQVNYQDTGAVALVYGDSGDPGWIPEDVNDDGDINYQDTGAVALDYGENYE